ncbi:MAG: acetyl/propionyl/methylcrotonyl-CoA carboxylase subunit alpha [Beijerinckiaceae bacterium]
MKLTSVLIANRGEIACRVIRTAKRLGMRTIAVYSEADAKAPHVSQADEAYLIGPAPARDSYLRADTILEVAKKAKADCVHPGYGFLSENTDFAAACAAAGIVFVGPPSSAIEAMGLKDAAKALVEKAGVPVVPGYHGSNQDPAFLKEKAYSIGYPVLIKAVAGGGGKGMKRVDKHADFEEALASAQREGKNSFGDARVLIEKYVTAPRHVEIQVFGDSHGNVVHLFERDCSAQRRHQKVIEEAPAPGMTDEVRAAMGKAAVDAAKAVGYVGAGTVEFIVDGSRGLRTDGFYFMEMNTRLQVEHPVTEMITGLDLVELQFRVASGEALPFKQGDLKIQGHAVEARVYAEDPEHDFLPSTGKLWALRLPEETATRPGDFPSPLRGGWREAPGGGDADLSAMASATPTPGPSPQGGGEVPGIRVDSGVIEGGAVTPHYDPMIAKVIAHGATRHEALDRLSAALTQTIVAGPKSNVAFLKALANHPDFRASKLDTGLIEREKVALGAVEQPVDAEAVAAGADILFTVGYQSRDPSPNWINVDRPSFWCYDPWINHDHFALGGPRKTNAKLVANGRILDAVLTGRIYSPHVTISALNYAGTPSVVWPDDEYEQIKGDPNSRVVRLDDAVLVIRNNRQTRVALFDPFDVDLDAMDDTGGASVKSPMHGKLVALMVQTGDAVTKGQKLAIVEAMKMEHALVAPRDGTVAEVIGAVGAQVGEGARVVVLAEVA